MKKRKIYLLILFALQSFFVSVHAQNIGINATGALPDSSAALDIASTSTGVLVPRMTTAQMNAINRPAIGLMVYNTTTSAFMVNTGTPASPAWSRIIYNTVNSLGPIDSTSLRFNTIATTRMIIDSMGSVGIGNSPVFSSKREKLLVDAGVTTSYNLIGAKGSYNNYLQFNIQNQSNGSSASTDVVATADNGDEGTFYVDMGINGSGYSDGFFGDANDAYLYNIGQNLIIGTGSTGKSLQFYTGGGSTTNERMRISSTGYMGIGTTSPTSTLDINGSVSKNINTTTSNLTLGATHYTVIITGGTPAITLPAASGCSGRIYVIVNHTNNSRTISTYTEVDGSTGNSVPSNSSITIQSDGSNWYQIH